MRFKDLQKALWFQQIPYLSHKMKITFYATFTFKDELAGALCFSVIQSNKPFFICNCQDVLQIWGWKEIEAYCIM